MSSNDDVVIDVRNVSKWFQVQGKGVKKGPSEDVAREQDEGGKNRFQVLKDVSFKVRRGETVGIVGRNGAGKSTLLRIISGMMDPDRGEVDIAGQAYSVMGMGVGFQKNLTGRENIHIKGAVMGAPTREVARKFDWIVDFSELGDYIDQPVRTYSKGMTARLAFAITFAFDPKILIVDEALSGGDSAFKRKAEARLNEINDSGATILLVSHGGVHHKRLCDRTVLIDKGCVLSDGPPKPVLQYYDRILNSEPREIAQVLKEIRAADPYAEEAAEAQPAASVTGGLPPSQRASGFDTSLRPKGGSASKPRGATISSIVIKDRKSQEKVNTLAAGSRFKIRIDVDFGHDIKNASAEIIIKSEEGDELFRAKSNTKNSNLVSFKKGDKASFPFDLHNRLLEGVYYVDAVVSGDGGDGVTTLHRVSDMTAFKALPASDRSVSGVVDLSR